MTTMAGVAGQWSVKDIIAHIMSYEQYTADRMAEIMHGESYAPARNQAALDAFLEKFGYPDFGSALLTGGCLLFELRQLGRREGSSS